MTNGDYKMENFTNYQLVHTLMVFMPLILFSIQHSATIARVIALANKPRLRI